MKWIKNMISSDSDVSSKRFAGLSGFSTALIGIITVVVIFSLRMNKGIDVKHEVAEQVVNLLLGLLYASIMLLGLSAPLDGLRSKLSKNVKSAIDDKTDSEK